jgi:hypothetical protein
LTVTAALLHAYAPLCCIAAVTTTQKAIGDEVCKPEPTIIITDNSAFGNVFTSAKSTGGRPAYAFSSVSACAGQCP